VFVITFLGDSFPSIDLFGELRFVGGKAFFFAQVKTTRSGIHENGKRLRAQISIADRRGLLGYKVPCYFFGVDDATEEVYIMSATSERGLTTKGVLTRFPLNEANLLRLWQEVEAYWKGLPPASLRSVFDVEAEGKEAADDF
jgi:hypothetical protein